jgi:hypothetical protein
VTASVGAHSPRRRRCGLFRLRGFQAVQYGPAAFTCRVTKASPAGRNSQSSGSRGRRARDSKGHGACRTHPDGPSSGPPPCEQYPADENRRRRCLTDAMVVSNGDGARAPAGLGTDGDADEVSRTLPRGCARSPWPRPPTRDPRRARRPTSRHRAAGSTPARVRRGPVLGRCRPARVPMLAPLPCARPCERAPRCPARPPRQC